ncbi:MAG: hypothetical protein R6V04_00850 [bacterium]
MNNKSLLKKIMKKRKFIIICIIGICLIIIFMLIKIPLHISTIGSLHPQSEWKIVKSNPDEVIISLHNYLTTEAGDIKSFIFNRGDVVNIKINSSIKHGELVKSGDTIGVIHSANLEERLAELNGNLIKANATLKSYKTGEKQSLVDEAEHNIIHAKLQVTEQKTIVSRMKELLEKNLVSKEEYEIAENRLALYKAEVKIAEAQLNTVTTGVKKGLIEQIKAEIKFYHKQLSILKDKKKDYNLISPIEGNVNRFFNSDTLLLIQDLSTMIICFPCKLYHYHDVKIGQKVLFFSPGLSLKHYAKIVRKDSAVKLYNNQQTMYAYAEINKPNIVIYPGMIVKCKIFCGNINILEYIKRIFHSVNIR